MLSALVLTAGVGSRLDPLTRVVAKPAVPVAGMTLVERVLGWLVREGVREAVLNLHHRPETIAGVVGDGAHLGLRVRYSWEQPLLGSAGGPRHALPLLGDTFLIVNGDTLCDFPLGPMFEAHRASGADVTMALVPNAAPDRYNSVMLDDENRVRGFVPKQAGLPGEGPTRPDGGRVFRPGSAPWHFVGVQIVRASVFAALPDGVPAETVAGIYRDAVAAGTLEIHGYRATTSFLDVGTPRDYLAAALELSGDPAGRVVESGATVDTSARVTRSVVWSGVTIGAGAALDDCIAAGGAQIPAGFAARGAVLLPATLALAGDAARIQDDIALFQMEAGSSDPAI